jgi:hypothetical protein
MEPLFKRSEKKALPGGGRGAGCNPLFAPCVRASTLYINSPRRIPPNSQERAGEGDPARPEANAPAASHPARSSNDAKREPVVFR